MQHPCGVDATCGVKTTSQNCCNAQQLLHCTNPPDLCCTAQNARAMLHCTTECCTAIWHDSCYLAGQYCTATIYPQDIPRVTLNVTLCPSPSHCDVMRLSVKSIDRKDVINQWVMKLSTFFTQTVKIIDKRKCLILKGYPELSTIIHRYPVNKLYTFVLRLNSRVCG